MLNPQPYVMNRRATDLRSDLRSSSMDAAAHGIMIGTGETYFAAFVLAVGLGEIVAGMIACVPLVVGGLIQLISPWMMKHWLSAKQWVVSCAVLQALSFLPFLWAASAGEISASMVLMAAGFYWGMGLATGPAWNAWMGELVPRKVRSRYFSLRTRTAQLCVMVGFLLGGGLLQVAEDGDWLMTGFAVLFVLALVSRSASAWFMSQQRSVDTCFDKGVNWRQALASLRDGRGSKLLLYLVVVQAAIQLSGPYLTTYMLGKMQLSYAQFTGLLAAVYVAKVVSLPLLGSLASRLGAWRLLWIGGVGIAPISACWVISDNLMYAFLLQVYSGVAWAAFELGFALLFFESIQQRYRTQVLTIYNVVHSGAAATGTLLGAGLLNWWSASIEGYYWLFAASTAGRILALGLLLQVPRWKVLVGSIGFRPLTVRPGAASTDAVVLASLPDQTNGRDKATDRSDIQPADSTPPGSGETE